MDRRGNFSGRPDFSSCVQSVASRYIFTASFIVYLLFLPLFLFVLYVGFNKWKKPQASGSGGLSHSDVFTLHMVAMEMTCFFGSCVTLYGQFGLRVQLLSVGVNTVATTVSGQMLFHSLTCVERYLAVVHPVVYLRLKKEGGVTVRNISVAFVWVFSVVFSAPMIIIHTPGIYGFFGLILSIASLPLVLYCSVCVLCRLIGPKPGEGGVHRKQIVQSKRSIFYTIVAILGALLLRLMAFIVSGSLNFWLSTNDVCAVMAATFCSTLPSSLVLPLLFLHRARKK